MSIHNYTLANGDSSATVTAGLNGNFTALSNAEESTQRRVGVLENTVGGSGYAEFKNFMKYVYPVGSYYWSSNSTNPSTLFGGTWERIKDKFVLAAGDVYTAGTTGGEAMHILTEGEMPAHYHSIQSLAPLNGEAGNYFLGVTSGGQSAHETGTVGSSQPHNNMPPYIVAYCWRRTAL